jgi:Pyruvate/2-oxoacid:ferredoxin oxidoreductase gamma subunit
MDGFAIIGFVFGLMGMVAFVRLEKLVKTLKEKGVLEENYKDE